MPTDAKRPLQLNNQGQPRHFISLGGLPHELLTGTFGTVDSSLGVDACAIKKALLPRDKTVCSVFLKSSTRTRTTFELAAQRLPADVIGLSVSTSSTSKGGALTDTLRNLEAMAADIFVVYHSDSGAAHFTAEHVSPDVAMISGDDGRHAHPTQGVFDMLIIRRRKGNFEQLSVTVIGDILHSRVVRSNMLVFRALGYSDIRVTAPCVLLPIGLGEQYGVHVFTNVGKGLRDVDVVIMLRLQREYIKGGLLPNEGGFFKLYGLTEKRLKLAKPDAAVIHPGPVNRGVEIESTATDGARSVIPNQVACDITIRTAVLPMATNGQNTQHQSEQKDAE